MKKLLAIVVLGLLLAGNALAWQKKEFKSEFDNDKQVLIFSDFVKPSTPLSSPYNDIKAQIIYSCLDGRGAVRFNMEPNLTDGSFGVGLDQNYSMRAKVDDKMISIRGNQPENSRTDINIKKKYIKKLFKGQTIMIEFKHYVGIVHYKFDLSTFPGC